MFRSIYYRVANYFPMIGKIFSLLKHKIRFDKPVRMSVHGFLLSGTDDMVKGNFEQDESQFLKDKFRNYKRFVNIGANIGYYIAMAQHIGVDEIIGFEPNPANYKLLQRNSSLNSHKNTELINAAVGESKGKLKLYGDTTGSSLIPGWSGSSKTLHRMVEVISMDDYFSNYNLSEQTLILIDIEGYELMALKGMKNLLSLASVDLIIEICYREHWANENPFFQETYDLLRIAGYKCYSIHDERKKPLSTYSSFKSYAEKNQNFHNYFFTKSLNYF